MSLFLSYLKIIVLPQVMIFPPSAMSFCYPNQKVSKNKSIEYCLNLINIKSHLHERDTPNAGGISFCMNLCNGYLRCRVNFINMFVDLLPIISDCNIIIAFRKFCPQQVPDHDTNNRLCFFLIPPMSSSPVLIFLRHRKCHQYCTRNAHKYAGSLKEILLRLYSVLSLCRKKAPVHHEMLL